MKTLMISGRFHKHLYVELSSRPNNIMIGININRYRKEYFQKSYINTSYTQTSTNKKCYTCDASDLLDG